MCGLWFPARKMVLHLEVQCPIGTHSVHVSSTLHTMLHNQFHQISAAQIIHLHKDVQEKKDIYVHRLFVMQQEEVRQFTTM